MSGYVPSPSTSNPFNNAPVVGATALGDGNTVVVTSGNNLFTVTRDGTVTLIGPLIVDATGAAFSASALAYTAPCLSNST